jgi:branched-chain amino acid transport system permease protein
MLGAYPLRPIFIPIAAAAGFFLPAGLGGFGAAYSACVLIAIFAVMAYGLDTIVSDLGEVSLAHTVFFAAGAYATALLSTGLGFGPILTFLGSIFVAVVIAALLGLVTLHLREFVFSLVTYAVAVVAVTVAQNWSLLGGSDGLRGIPAFSVSIGPFSYAARTDLDLWPIAYGLLLLVLYIVYSFRRSRLGHAAIMTHLNPRLAIMSGVDPYRTRIQVFVFSAPITASAGWLYAYQRAYVSADVLETYFLVLMLTAVVLIGRRLLLGPLFGMAFILLQEKFVSFGGYVDKIILGSALILSLAFLPRGLVGLLEPIKTLTVHRAAVFRKKHASGVGSCP